MGREAPAIEEAGAAHNQRTHADADDAGASIGLLLQPGCDRRVVVVAHRRNDHVVGARGISPVEAGEILRHLDLQRRIQQDTAATRRHRLHVGNAGTLQHRMRQQEVGHLGAFVQRDDCDHRLAGAARFQSLDEGLRLALGHRCIDWRRGHLHTGSGSCPRHLSMTGPLSAQLSNVL